MTERLFGMETEYGLAVRNRAKPTSNRDPGWSDRFFHVARECLPHLPAADGGGFYLSNGARFYMDCGHPEMTTPECTNPWDVVRYMHAGERMLRTVAEQLQSHERDVAEVLVFKTNVDHSGAGTTWGCHTSFLHRAHPGALPAQIIPHLVSRIIYSGAGGLNLDKGVLRFTLSPRVNFLSKEVSACSTRERAIFHTKDESHSGQGYHRLHIICGETLCSEIALWLNMGATALIVAMIEAGLRPGDAVQLSDPLGAMRCFASDPSCKQTVHIVTGDELTAVQIQRRYLEIAEAHLHDSFMPVWADRVCAQWRIMLDRLETGAPASVASTLDWAIKLCLFFDRAERRGLNVWPQGNGAGPETPRHGLRESTDTVALYQELCEVDTRFGHLSEQGVFAALDRAGVLTHRFPGVDNIEHAVANPPTIGRAWLRGKCVQRFAGQGSRYACGWRGVWDREENLFLDLADPFAAEEKWQPLPRDLREYPHSIQGHVRSVLAQVLVFHDQGNYEAAAAGLNELEGLQIMFGSGERYEYQRLFAWVNSRRGFLNGVAALDRVAQSQPNFSLINDYVCTYRYQGLIPPPAIESWIEKGRAQLAQNPDLEPSIAVAFLDHYGYTLLRNGQPEEALTPLQDACDARRRSVAHPHNISRALADLADVHRALGNREEALRCLDEAQNLQLVHGFKGDYADFALTYRAKLEPNRDRALALLAEAKGIQTSLRNRMGEARTLLLEARLSGNTVATAAQKARLVDLGNQLPALAQCRVLSKILSRWEDWVGWAGDAEGGMDFCWWL